MGRDEALQEAQAEFERSRASSVRLMEALAQKMRSSRAVRQVSNGVSRVAEFAHVRSGSPAAAIVATLAGVAAGFLAVTLVSSRGRR